MIAVESNIPMPASCIDLRGRPKGSPHVIYPWDEMKVGDSFVMRNMGSLPWTKKIARSLIDHRHKYSPGSYDLRVMREGERMVVRIWRIA